MLAHIEPFFHWHTPIAWTGYILFVDAFVWKRRGASWLRNSPAELLFVACASVPLWVVFEGYNKYSLRNWYYVGLPENPALRYVGYVWAFATIWPAIFETADLVSCLRDRRAPADRVDAPLRAAARPDWLAVRGRGGAVAGRADTPPVEPDRDVSRGARLARVHPAARSAQRTRRRANRSSETGGGSGWAAWSISSSAGLICGFVWEFWNYWSGTKWIYNVPILPEREDLRDAGPRLWRVPAVCGRMFRHVRRGAALAVALVAEAGRDLMAVTRTVGRYGATSHEHSTRGTRDQAALRIGRGRAERCPRARGHAAARPPAAGRCAARHTGGAPARQRCALRIRMENGKSRLTFKGPVQPSMMKLREELETVVGDGEVLLRIFEELGLQVWFRYEKYREEFSHEDVIVAIDETPVGVFVEIEGSEQRHRGRGGRARPHARRLHRRFVPRAVPAGARAARAHRRRHGVRRVCMSRTARARSHGRPRHPAAAADLLRAKAAVPVNGETAGPPRRALARRRRASPTRPQSPPSAGNHHRVGRRRLRPGRPGALFVGTAGPRVRRRAAARVAAARRSRPGQLGADRPRAPTP